MASIVFDKFIHAIVKYLKFDASDDRDVERLQCLIDCIAPICLQNAFIWHQVQQIIINPMYNCLIQCLQSKTSSLVSIKACFKTMSVILDYNQVQNEKQQENEQIIDKFLSGIICEFPFEKLSDSQDEYELFLIVNCIVSKMISNLCNKLQLKFIKYCMNRIKKQMIESNEFYSFQLLIDLICIASCKQLLPHNQMFDFLINLQKYLLFDLNCTNIKMMNHFFECIACLLNKSDSKMIISPYINHDALDSILKMIENENGNQLQISLSLYYIIWIIKSLSIRCFRDAQNEKLKKMIKFLCKCLLSKNNKIAQIASFGFDVIMKESVLILNKKNECKISILYKQKFFVFTIDYILNMISQNDNDSDTNQTYLLLAVCYLMKNVPNAVLTLHLSELLPLMIKSFESTLETLKVSILFLFEILFKSNLECIVPYIQVIVPILLELTKYKKSAKVRISALNCLLLLTGLEYSTLHIMTKKVIRSLSDALDDKKKKVRIIAVECRNQWYLLHEE